MIKPIRYIALLLLVTTATFISCKKEKDQPPSSSVSQTGIKYADSTTNGKNILVMVDSTVLLNGANYGFGTELEKDAGLSIIITNLSPLNTATGKISQWFYTNSVGWSVGSYNTVSNTQKFTALIKGKNDLSVMFTEQPGSPAL